MAGREVTVNGAKEFYEMSECLNEFRRKGLLCDTVVYTEDKQFRVHRVVLAASSPYFRALFTNGLRETDQLEVRLEKVDSAAFRKVLDFMYNKDIVMTLQTTMQVLPLADSLLVSGLSDFCSRKISAELRIDNCLEIWRFADSYTCLLLSSLSKRYILQHFQEIYQKSPDFCDLHKDEILSLIKDDELYAENEDNVYDAVELWIDYDRKERKVHFYDLFFNVRLPLISEQFFRKRLDTTDNELIWFDAKCRKYLHEMRNITNDDNQVVETRIPRDIVFCIGGWSGGSPIGYFETFDSSADRWITHESLCDRAPRAYHGMVALNGQLYLIGGFDGSQYFNTVRVFDPIRMKWRQAAPMHHQRCYVATALLGNLIYACGGYDGRWRLQTAERYDAENNQWSLISPMLNRRSDAGCTCHNNKVIMVGGFDGENCLNSAEVYNPEMDQWTTLISLNERRSGVSIIGLNGNLYALGGFDGERRLKCVERFNEEDLRWEYLPDMHTARSNFAVVILHNQIYVIGGFDGSYTISCVEKYNPTQDDWIEVKNMTLNRSALRACILSDLSNVRTYSEHGYKLRLEEEAIKKNEKLSFSINNNNTSLSESSVMITEETDLSSEIDYEIEAEE